MEVLILDKLGYEINSPTTRCYQDRFLRASGDDIFVRHFTEVSFVKHKEIVLKLISLIVCRTQGNKVLSSYELD